MAYNLPVNLEASPDHSPEHAQVFDQIVLSRRSVRKYTDEPVPENLMQHCLDLALLSPSSSNLQPWEFHWVRDLQKKSKMVEYCFSQPTARTAQELVVCIARTDSWKNIGGKILDSLKKQPGVSQGAIQYYEKDVPKMLRQGPFGLLGYFRKISYFVRGFSKVQVRGPGGPSELTLWAVKSATLAIQTFMLAIRAHGYDSCPMEGFDSKRVAKLLNLPKDAHIVMVVSIGKRAVGGIYGPRLRFERDLFIKTH